MKNKIIILIFISFVLSQTGGGLSFMNIAGSSRMNALGNTMFSDFSNPTSLLLNPANTWSQTNYKISINNAWYDPVLDIQLSHIFLSFKIKESLFSFGFIEHGVKNIESYSNEAVFEGFFNFSDIAFLLGYSHRTSNVFWGFSGAVISENFTNIDYERSYYYQYDIGVSLVDLQLTNSINLSSGFSMKNIFDKDFNYKNTANSNNIMGSVISYSSSKSNLIINSYFDFLFQKTLDVNTGRFGLEIGYGYNRKSKPDSKNISKYKSYELSLCFGYNDFRFLPLDSFSLQETNQYNSQLKYGIGLKFPFYGNTVDIFGGQSIATTENPLSSKFMTISFSKRKRY